MKILGKFNRKQIIIGIVLLLIAVIAIIYLAFTIFFSSHFWFNTTINGVDCSRKNVTAVEEIITAEIDKYKLELEQRGDSVETINGVDINLRPTFDGSLDKELKGQNSFGWIVSLFKKSNIEVEKMVEYDADKLNKVVNGLQSMEPSNVSEPKDAYLSEYISGSGYEIVPEEEGNLVNQEILEEVLKTSITGLQEKVSLEDTDCYEEPKLRADDQKLTDAVEELNTYAKAAITYEFGEDRETLDGTLISQWLTVDSDMKVSLDEEKVTEYVKNLSSERNTAYKSKSLKTSYGTTVTISNGDYGWWINQENETEKLLGEIREGTVVSREPEYKQRANSFGANDYGDTYVEINLTAQHIFFYKNGSLIVDSDLVSGNLAKGHGTPSGAFGITYTQRDATLRGEDYATPVSYWMPFNGGIGLHDANWRSDFGGNYYKSSGSHGCINLPFSVAKKIFENINTGDPVLVYELSGTESPKATAQDAATSVISAINAIGEVTLESGGAISNARGQYNALSDTGRGYVKNYDTLVNAEAAYEALVSEQQSQNETQNAAQAVVDAINAIGEVTEDKRDAINNARAMYEALADAAKEHVGNYSALVEAEAALAAL